MFNLRKTVFGSKSSEDFISSLAMRILKRKFQVWPAITAAISVDSFLLVNHLLDSQIHFIALLRLVTIFTWIMLNISTTAVHIYWLCGTIHHIVRS